MSLKDIYTEIFSLEEIVSLINAYAAIVNTIGPDEDFICKLDTLMDVLKEKSENE